MIVGASPESDRQILKLTEGLYRKYELRRCFFSLYSGGGGRAPACAEHRAAALREHRLYQADWLLRYYHFQADEILMRKTRTSTPASTQKMQLGHPPFGSVPGGCEPGGAERLLRVPGTARAAQNGSRPLGGPGALGLAEPQAHRGGAEARAVLYHPQRGSLALPAGAAGTALRRRCWIPGCSAPRANS